MPSGPPNRSATSCRMISWPDSAGRGPRWAATPAAGGGGPPVYADPRLGWEGVDAVVDKDRVAAILGTRLGSDTLLILTNVDAVYRGWGTPHQEPIRRLRAG